MYFDNFQSFEQEIDQSSAFTIYVHLHDHKHASIESSPILIGELAKVIAEYEIAVESKSVFSIWDRKKVFLLPSSTISGMEIKFIRKTTTE